MSAPSEGCATPVGAPSSHARSCGQISQGRLDGFGVGVALIADDATCRNVGCYLIPPVISPSPDSALSMLSNELASVVETKWIWLRTRCNCQLFPFTKQYDSPTVVLLVASWY